VGGEEERRREPIDEIFEKHPFLILRLFVKILLGTDWVWHEERKIIISPISLGKIMRPCQEFYEITSKNR
jgi:hypothetical protein